MSNLDLKIGPNVPDKIFDSDSDSELGVHEGISKKSPVPTSTSIENNPKDVSLAEKNLDVVNVPGVSKMLRKMNETESTVGGKTSVQVDFHKPDESASTSSKIKFNSTFTKQLLTPSPNDEFKDKLSLIAIGRKRQLDMPSVSVETTNEPLLSSAKSLPILAKPSTCSGSKVEGSKTSGKDIPESTQSKIELPAKRLFISSSDEKAAITEGSSQQASTSSLAIKNIKPSTSIDPIELSDTDSSDIEVYDASGNRVESKKKKLMQLVLVYPAYPKDPCPARLHYRDLQRLQRGEYFNDELIRFALKYALKELLSEQMRGQILLLDSLVSLSELNTKSLDQKKNYVKQNQLKSGHKYLVFPCHYRQENGHWVLVIVSGFESLFQSPVEGKVAKLSCKVAFMNSFSRFGKENEANIIASVKIYFRALYGTVMHNGALVDEVNVESLCPDLFQQQNCSDCGLFVIEYFKYFFANDHCQCVRQYVLDRKPLCHEMDWQVHLEMNPNAYSEVSKFKREKLFNIIKQENNKQSNEMKKLKSECTK